MADRLRVVHVIARLNVGGPAAMLGGLIEGGSDDIEHLVITGRTPPDEASWDSVRPPVRAQVLLPRLGPGIDPVADAAAGWALRRMLHGLRPDIVHTHTAKAGFIGRAVPGPWRRVHTFHGHVLHGYFGPGTTRLYAQVERILARRTTLLLSVGARVREDLLAAGIGRPGQHRVVLPGVAPAYPPARADARDGLGLPSGVPVLAWVGRLTGIKRPDRAVAVVERLHALGVPAHLLVAGGGELLDATRTAAASARVPATFLGWTGAVESVYAASDLVLSTSDNEGVPVGLVEAAACGLPAVATDVGGVPDVVVHGRTGLRAPADVGQLAAACARLLADDGLRRRLAAGARLRAGTRFSLARMVDDHEAVYREAVQCAP